MNGPVHGVATKAASNPVAKLPLPLAPPPVIAIPGISNPPRKFAVSATASRNSATTTPGSCNWNAQPTASPLARKISSSPPSARQAMTTPAV